MATRPGPERDGREGVSRSRSFATDPSAVCRTPNRREPRRRAQNAPRVEGRKMRAADTARNGFPFSDFRHSLTLFSKFFASFPHGTCSLSVMSQYLALEGIYLPIKAAIPSNPTLQGRIVRPRSATSQDSHLLRYHIPMDFSDGRGRWRLSRLQFGGPRGPPDWRRELCPLHSPLLGASRLFSSPPLSDMLKFSG